jgi:hypothetical protein
MKLRITGGLRAVVGSAILSYAARAGVILQVTAAPDDYDEIGGPRGSG